MKRQAKQWLSADFESVRQVSRGLLLGYDLFDNIVPLIRGNVGGYLVPRYGAKPGELPFEGLVAAELSERPPAVPAKVGVQQPGQPSATKDTMQARTGSRSPSLRIPLRTYRPRGTRSRTR